MRIIVPVFIERASVGGKIATELDSQESSCIVLHVVVTNYGLNGPHFDING